MMRKCAAGNWSGAVPTLGLLGSVILWVGCAGTAGTGAPAPVASPERPAAIRLDRDKLAGVGLTEYPPMTDDYVLEGGRGHRGHVFYSGDEFVVEVWDADASKLALGDFPYDEFVLILSGKLVLTDDQGTMTEYSAGESLVVPKGFKGTWEMIGNYREVVVI